MIRRHGVGDGHADVGPVERELLVAERIHQPDHVVSEGSAVVAICWFVRQSDATLVDRNDLEVAGKRRHQHAPGIPGLRPAVHQQQRRAVAADNGMQAHLTGVDVAAAERVGEAGWEVRRARDGARPVGVGSWVDDVLMRISFRKSWSTSSLTLTAQAYPALETRALAKRMVHMALACDEP